MNSQRTTLTTAVSLAATVLAIAGRAGADPVTYTQTPLSNVVAQLDQQYGVNIVLKGSLMQTPDRQVSFSVGNTGATPTRLQVINALANAAGVDFQKGFVVSKIASDEAPPPVKIDSNGYVVFKSTTVPARDAISEVATTDNATIQVSDDVTGDVTFPQTTMRTSEAADVIARQTHTRWRVYYALTPGNLGQRGKVVDRNNDGQAIVELPFTYYGSKTQPGANPDEDANNPAAQTNPADANANPAPNVPPVSAGPAAGGVDVAPYSYYPSLGYAPMPFTYGNNYAYGPFGNPYQTQYGYFGYPGGYGMGGYGYPGGGFSTGGVNILGGGGGYGPWGGYGGGPVTF